MRLTILLLILIATAAFPAAAQSGEPLVVPAAEYSIGFDCPIAQTLNADATVLWVLMQGCLSRAFSLQAFSLADGTRLDMGSDFSTELDPLRDTYLASTANQMAFIDDGVLQIIYADNETYAPHTIVLALDGAATTAGLDALLADLLPQYTEYPETTVYSADHTLAAVVGATELTVLDIATGQPLFTLPVEQEFNAYPSFSPDGQTLYVPRLDNYDDMEDYASTLSAYSLPAGAPLSTAALPSPFAWVSPDGRYAAVQLGSNDGTSENLFVVDLASGSTTQPFPLYEPETKAMTCVNDGRSLSDVDFTKSGRLSLTSINWLPDSSGFVFTRSYGGEGAGGGRPCAFNYSRLNVFTVGEST